MSVLRKIALGLVLLVLILLGLAAWMLRSRAEAIPDELPAINVAEADPQKLVIPGSGGLGDLVLADLKGRTVYLIVEDRESMAARESSAMSRAMARWGYPDTVSGFAVGDADGFALLASKIEEFVGPMRPELRLPLYIDFQGAVTKTFKLPKGHVGIVVIDPTGAVAYRHSGKMEPAEIEKLRGLLGATLPVVSPAPAFKVGELDNAACAGRTCAMVFLGGPVARKDIPGGKQGFEGSNDDSMKQFAKPDVRLAGIVVDSDTKLDSGKVGAQLVGQIDGAELKHWKTAPDSSEARAAFQIPAGEAALVVLDPQGNVVMRELGRVPMYKFGILSEFIGVELSDRDEP
ncbi:hypothetical protein [Nannocystis bainbridge]|uniref:Thioredoxin domain-containing protein n=1 Tax=Nannocystis bainbridge TaxID=2995303 RepID=A0ABT5DTQ4_9BACT|nr:hypothetical protein [Nannocystis bainbridge]MDC0717025.1 hypothetical protein [Nannocystis bainbridge]